MIATGSSRSASERLGRDARRPILFVSSTRHEGGVERVGVRLAVQISQAADGRFPPVFACRPQSFTHESCLREGVPTIPYAPANSGDLAAAGALAAAIRKLRPAVVHVHSRRDYLPVSLAVGMARVTGHACRLFFHCHLVRALGDPPGLSGRFFAASVERFLAVSDVVRTDLLARHPDLPPNKVVVLPNGVDMDSIGSAGERERAAIRARWEICADTLVLGMVGRLDAKGQKHLLNLLPELKAALAKPVKLLFVGGEGPAGYEGEIRRLARELGVENDLALAGPQTDVAAYLAAMDIFAHLPEDEAFGLAIAEAMAAGLPVVASSVPACREIVVEGETGYVADIGDRSRLMNALSELAASPALRARMGQAGRERAAERYSSARQVARLLALYEEAAAR